MASYNKTLQLLASKLGLSEEEKVLSKAAEFERLLQTKTVAGSNLSDTSKFVFCLDLAASLFGADLDVKTAIKYSGLKPIAYTSNRKTVENLLEINSSKLTVAQLCVTLQCTGIQEVAEKILEEYQRHSKVELDLSLPQYVCMAVYQAGRINKVKVSKVKINEKCRLKPAQWAMLEADWTKFVNEEFASAPKKRGRPAKSTVIADENREMEIDTKEETPTEIETEPYEDWRRRMLESAYKELEMREKENKKSPKNTPKKQLRIVLQKELCTQKERDIQRELRGTPKKDNGTQKDGTPKKDPGTLAKGGSAQKQSIPEEITPRKSPRKTPIKYSPYKPPTKGGGVRLLFPNFM
ncbi:origin recognition complex subunit 6 isoform X2 [Cydia strobilella]|uniref:origin recognition complex subunit 6 isoform X2 n=1 Tax=Cydia strobilella TaxID=1100964 RepID=UPI003005E6B7